MKYIYLIGFLILSVGVRAQQEFTLHTLDHVFQSAHTNPAIVHRHAVSVTLMSSFHLHAKNTGFTYNQIVSQIETDETGQRVLNLGQLAENLNLKNKELIHAGASVDLFALSFRAAKNRFSLNVTEHFQSRLVYNDGLLDMINEGNTPGGVTRLGGYNLNGSHYREIGLGYNRKMLADDKMVIGGRIKGLIGLANVRTIRSDVNLHTGSEQDMYEITASSDILVRTAGLELAEEGDMDYLLNTNNRGLGLDLGATYQFSEDIKFSASLINLGFISWKEGITNYESNGEFTFRGIEQDNLFDESFTFDETEIIDSLTNIFEFEETNTQYRTSLPTQMYLSAFYQLARNTTASATLYSEFISGMRRGLVLGINQKAGRWFQTSLTYAMHARSYNNLGLGIVIGTGLQFHVVTDNLLAVVQPGNTRMMNLRGGFNFAF